MSAAGAPRRLRDGGERLRIGVVGCGFQGRLHVAGLSAVEGAEVVAVCDRNLPRATALAAEHGIVGAYADHRELLVRHELDLVTVCTMPDTHREIARDAFAADADVLCEKPLALDLADGRAMVEAAEHSGRTLAVGFNLRYATAAQAVRRFVDDGLLGRPVCARGSMLETEIPWWGPHQVGALSGGGAIAATAVHMLDLLIWLAGSPEPTTASASAARLFPRKRAYGVPSPEAAERYDVEDLAFAHVRFADGFWLSLEGGWVWDEPGWECRFALVGDRAQAAAEPLRFWREEQGRLCDATGGARGDLDFPGSVERQLADVVARLREGRPPLASGVDGLRVQAVVDAIYRSAAAGREVTVEPVAAARLDTRSTAT